MSDPIFILLSDPYSLEQRIWIYGDRIEAEIARDRSMSPDAEILSFRTHGAILEVARNTPVYLVVTREDEGIRIHGVFTSLTGVERCMSAHLSESRCHCTVAWPGQALQVPMRA